MRPGVRVLISVLVAALPTIMTFVCLGGRALAQTGAPSVPQGTPAKLVIVISTQEPSTPSTATLIKGLREGLASTPERKIDLMVEHLERYAPVAVSDGTMGEMLAQKYAKRRPDLIVALGTVAAEFANRIRARLWTQVPIIFSDSAPNFPRIASIRNMTGIVEALEMDRTLHNALQLFPTTRRIYAINGTSIFERALQSEFEQTVKGLGRELEIVALAGKSFEETAAVLQELPRDSIAYFLSFHTDNTDRSFAPNEVLAALAPAAGRPIFGNDARYFGSGLLGGWFIDYGQLGRELSTQALQILSGIPAAELPIERSSSIRPMFDARQTQRWSVQDEELPAGSIVQYREVSLWKRYRTWIITFLTAFAAQAGLIGTLLWERGRRRKAEARALALSGQVIEATENERGRIARELHDDISQRLALLSIEIDQFANGDKARSAGMGANVHAFSGKTREIADDVHQLAKELHPTTLKMLGLSKAVRLFSAELEARHDVAISLNEKAILPELPESVAVSLYRVVQEALQNVVKHSNASEASVTLGSEGGMVNVVVADNGTGFDPVQARSGIGLDGMRERLRLVGGSIRIDSRPGSGTRVEARIPIRRAA